MKRGFQSGRSDGRFCVDILSIPNVVGQKRNMLYRGNSERVHETHTSEVHQRDYETHTSENHQRVGENGTFESMWGRDCRILAADTSEEQRFYQAKALKITWGEEITTLELPQPLGLANSILSGM